GPVHDTVLRVLHPGDLPVERGSLAGAAARLAADQRDDRLLRATGPARRRAGLALADELLACEPIGPAGGERRASADRDEHDRHFGVLRVRGDSGAILLASLLVSYLDLLDDVERGGTTLDRTKWTDLLRVPTLVFDFALRRPPASVGADVPVPAGRGELQPHRRWHVGHRLFFTLIQVTIQAVTGLSQAARARDVAGVRECVDLVRLTSLGSAAALRLAADFSPVDYQRTVRPTMLPPHVRPGFSGLQTRDHHHLVRAMGKLRADMATVAELGAPHTTLISAIRSLYDAHAHVCTRFGGGVAPSLRMAALGQHDGKGAEVVRGLAKHRESLIEPALGNTRDRPHAYRRSGEETYE
ncbi:MAG: hypothetical protein ABW215_08275, partial [Kibdelosporangium sp.]